MNRRTLLSVLFVSHIPSQEQGAVAVEPAPQIKVQTLKNQMDEVTDRMKQSNQTFKCLTAQAVLLNINNEQIPFCGKPVGPVFSYQKIFLVQ